MNQLSGYLVVHKLSSSETNSFLEPLSLKERFSGQASITKGEPLTATVNCDEVFANMVWFQHLGEVLQKRSI
jgi:hypothetical protein